MSETLGAIPPNEKSILKRGGGYMRKPNAIPGGGRCHYGTEGNASEQSGTSIFDPVLCEIAYRWFSPPGGTILDPFAGGSVRGIVAAKLGRQYIGIDLSKRQIEANRQQWESMSNEPCLSPSIIDGDQDNTPLPPIEPVWHIGDSQNIKAICEGVEADLLFTCPPYADLEIYSDDPADISTMDYPSFIGAYRKIIADSCSLLCPDRFACVVVGEVRDKKGNYYNFVGDTVRAFKDAGLEYYNEAILVTAVGSLPIRVGRQFAAGRKLGKTHQNVLVFVKGNGKKAADYCGVCDFNISDTIETP